MLSEIAAGLDPVFFAREFLGFNPDEMQAAVLRSCSKRLILNCSRQWGKSSISALKALHWAVFYPETLILLLSPSLRQSSELFRKVADFTRMCEDLPEKTEDSKLFMTLSNGSRILSLPGREGTVRGYTADLLIIDEGSQVTDELFLSIRPMLAVTGGALMLLSTPRGKRGFFHGVWTKGGPDWERYEVKAEQCARIPESFLEEERHTMPPRWYRQEYCCSFEENIDSMFDYALVERAFSGDVDPLFGKDLLSEEVKPLF